MPTLTQTVAAEGLVFRHAHGAAVDALDGVSLSVASGELCVLAGAPGSGKSTLLHVLGGLLRPGAGSLTIAGHDVAALDDAALCALRRAEIAFIFRTIHLVNTLAVEDNVLLPFALAPVRPSRAEVAAVLERVGLLGRRHARPAALTAAECQKVAIARALLGAPSVLLADDPTGDLDPEGAEEILTLLADVAHADGVAVLVATRDERALEHADRVVVLADGRIA